MCARPKNGMMSAMKPQEQKMIRALIVDDIPTVRQELGTLLELSGGLEIVGEATDGVEAIRQVEALRPDVVLMDLEMPVLDGFAATKQIKVRCPACRVVALTVHGDETTQQRARESGVDAFVVKGSPIGLLINAVTQERSQ